MQHRISLLKYELMTPYRFSDLFSKPDYPSVYTPQYVRFALLLNGYDFPFFDESFRVLELGTIDEAWHTIHQISLPHYEFVRIKAKDFETIDQKGFASDLGSFDLILCHDFLNHQEVMLSLINTHLKIGGIVCIHYHSMPGCAPLIALRDLMLLQIDPKLTGKERQMQALQALYFTDNYAQTNTAFFQQVPKAKTCLEEIKQTPFEQLEKDWLNPNWHPAYFSDIAKAMGNVRCQYVTSLNLPLQLEVCLPPKVARLMQAEENIIFRETIRDFGLNQLFRTDVFARGSTKASEQTLLNIPFCLTCPKEAVSHIQIPTPLGDLAFNEYLLFIEALAKDNYRPKTLLELQKDLLLKDVNSDLFLAIITVLVAANLVYPANPNFQQKSERLNNFTTPLLASSVLGSGLSLSRIGLFLATSYRQGNQSIEDCSNDVLQKLKQMGEHLIGPDGKELDPKAAQDLIRQEAKTFIEAIAPYLIAMNVLTKTHHKL